MGNKQGYTMSIYYPEQPPSVAATAPVFIAGSTLRAVITLRVFDDSLDVRYMSLSFQGTRRVWTYVGIDKTFKSVIVRENRMLISFVPGQDPILTKLKSFKQDSDKDFKNRVETRTLQGNPAPIMMNASTQPTAPTVRMRDPKGKVRLVPADQVPAALKAGGSLVDMPLAQGAP